VVQDGPIDGGMVDPFQEIKYAQSSIGRTRSIAIVFFAIQMAAVCRWTLPIRASPTFSGGKRIHDGPSYRAITGREYIGG
jgi:hypothetical protein